MARKIQEDWEIIEANRPNGLKLMLT